MAMIPTQTDGLPNSPTGAGASPAQVIVVGLDGSPTSWDAFCWATGEATRTNGRLIAVYVSPVVEGAASAVGVPFDYAAAEQARTEVAAELSDEARHRARELGIQLSFVRALGDPAHALTQFARSADADLIVIGKSTKMLHRLVGSLGRRLVSRHDAPVIVVVP
jgi:nucleotide-binding universal stress UspA family protein